ncbi:peptidase M28 [Polychaeton citri CBS 116435]|uniref:Peptide hydrolase n=1 Tax=Polychaeton citri CBS 116435 TaxID=1314669 RepID=A0A9P4UL53_9PEZI|nr:peptidase M28 [Polychaeton citri CBS 116435]
MANSKSSWNPIAFRPVQVTFIASAVYIAIVAVLLWVHLVVPSAPADASPATGINLTEAFYDLRVITAHPHSFQQRQNAVVRSYLLKRLEEILERNGVDYKLESSRGGATSAEALQAGPKTVTVFDDLESNATYTDKWRKKPWSIYQESENIIVYLRGTEDDESDWWHGNETYKGEGGVLVNAHLDSVPTAYGATDDGMGVVTILQLISHFTSEGKQPRHGIVALLNNGEEEGLNGAYAYLRHPIAQIPRTFLNLEGAGAGGRAMLFRSTDAEVTKFYARSRYPFGSVLSGDGFKRGLIQSGTDYSVFNIAGGLRGLDVAFFDPRARYHTDQDDARDTSIDSLWHMLSTSLETMTGLSSHIGSDFEGTLDDKGVLKPAKGSDGVWFDVLGRGFASLELTALFGLSVALLVAAPIVLILLELILVKQDKWYPFTRKRYLHNSDDDEAVQISGLRGFFRFPVIFIVSTAATVALAFLVTKVNPYILYSSEYSVWAMMLTAWFVIAWFLFTMADRVRPTALSRFHILLWTYIVSWIILVLVTVGEKNFQIAGGYFIVIYNAAFFAALLISYLEFLALPKVTRYVGHVASATTAASRSNSPSSRQLLGQDGEDEQRPSSSRAPNDDDDDEANERTSLLHKGKNRSRSRDTGTFLGFARRRHPETDAQLDEDEDVFRSNAYGDEQAWSGSLPQSTWLLQFLLIAPINLILVGQVALLLTSALHQTPADGSAVLSIYLMFAGLTVLLVLPLAPFLHRFKYQVPVLLLFIFAGCLVYNLLAFPFSRDARMKFFFNQQIDLTSGANHVILTGLDGFVQDVATSLPSAAGQTLACSPSTERLGLTACKFIGLAPLVAGAIGSVAPFKNNTSPENPYKSWLDYNITSNTTSSASFSLQGLNTRYCRVLFNSSITSLDIDGAGVRDSRFDAVADGGSSQLRLFSRDWAKNFKFDVGWKDGKAKGQTGRLACQWEEWEGNQIPALDEVNRFAPVWSTVTRNNDWLVEGFKDFEI